MFRVLVKRSETTTGMIPEKLGAAEADDDDDETETEDEEGGSKSKVVRGQISAAELATPSGPGAYDPAVSLLPGEVDDAEQLLKVSGERDANKRLALCARELLETAANLPPSEAEYARACAVLGHFLSEAASKTVAEQSSQPSTPAMAPPSPLGSSDYVGDEDDGLVNDDGDDETTDLPADLGVTMGSSSATLQALCWPGYHRFSRTPSCTTLASSAADDEKCCWDFETEEGCYYSRPTLSPDGTDGTQGAASADAAGGDPVLPRGPGDVTGPE